MLKQQLHLHIFYTHFHWDHVQGLPFFHPIYFPSTTMDIYSPLDNKICKDSLDILFDGTYSPFSGIDSMPSKIAFHKLNGKTQVGDLQIEYQLLNHDLHKMKEGNESFAYKFTSPKKKIIIASDHEASDGKSK